MAVIKEIDSEALEAWIQTRPTVIQDMIRQCPPDRLYRMKSTGLCVEIYSYAENRTVTVNVTGQFNCVLFDRQVFGISIDDLEECDLPGPDELIGTMLPDNQAQEFVASIRVEQWTD